MATLTQKEIKLIALLKKNLGQVGKTMTLKEMFLRAGYAPSTANSTHNTLDRIKDKEEFQEFIKELDDKRRLALYHMTEAKLKKASARDGAYISEVLTKQHQLLTGRDTEVKRVIVVPNELIEKNKLTTE